MISFESSPAAVSGFKGRFYEKPSVQHHSVSFTRFFGFSNVRAVPINIRCENLVILLGVDAAKARLSCTLPVASRGKVQAAYGITTSSGENGSGNLWNCGKVAGSVMQVEYAGGW